MKSIFVVALIWVVVLAAPEPAYASDAAYTIVSGTVVRQVNGCERDGACSVVVQTDAGEKSIVWNQGEAMPPQACRGSDRTAAEAAEALQPGDHVQIHVPKDTNDVLCGPNASVARLQ